MMKYPAHPGTVLKEAVFEPLGLSVSEAAERLNMQINDELAQARERQ